MYKIQGDFQIQAGLGTNFLKHIQGETRYYCESTNEYVNPKVSYWDIKNSCYVVPFDDGYKHHHDTLYIYVNRFSDHIHVRKLGFIKQFTGIKFVPHYYIPSDHTNDKIYLKNKEMIDEFNKIYGLYICHFSLISLSFMKEKHDISVSSFFEYIKKEYKRHIDISENKKHYEYYVKLFRKKYNKKDKLVIYNDFFNCTKKSGTLFDAYEESIKEYHQKNLDIVKKWDSLFLTK